MLFEGPCKSSCTVEESGKVIRIISAAITGIKIRRMNVKVFSIKVRDDVVLRFIRPDEAETVYKQVNDNRAYLGKWLPWVPEQKGPEDSLQNIQQRIVKAQTGETLGLGIYLDGKFIGSVGFNRSVAAQKKGSIGYWIAEEFQGKGIMTDCVRALVAYGFQTLGLHRIRIQCRVNNKKSAAIPERLGFTFEGIGREDEFVGGHFEDSRVYGILKQAWKR